jgi:CrcB protein
MPGPPRPLHLRPTAILVVFAGGAFGTLARYLVGIALPPLGPLPTVTLIIGGIPIATLLVNVVGAFLLGLLLGGIARRGVESRRGRVLRLLIGTGFMGGFTTYSSLAVETTGLLGGDAWFAVAYSLTTLVVGLGASLGGIALGSRLVRPRSADSGDGAAP